MNTTIPIAKLDDVDGGKDETLSEELSRLVAEYQTGQEGDRTEAWNLIADFSVENCEAICAALNAPEYLTASLDRERVLREALRRLLATINPGNADQHKPGCDCVIHEARAALAAASSPDAMPCLVHDRKGGALYISFFDEPAATHCIQCQADVVFRKVNERLVGITIVGELPDLGLAPSPTPQTETSP